MWISTALVLLAVLIPELFRFLMARRTATGAAVSVLLAGRATLVVAVDAGWIAVRAGAELNSATPRPPR